MVHLRTVARATLLATALMVALAVTPAAATPKCTSVADVGTFIGWCRCSSVTTPKAHVEFIGSKNDPWCKVSAPNTRIYFCDRAGTGNCDLQCTAPIYECTGQLLRDSKCKCALGKVRAVLRYNGEI